MKLINKILVKMISHKINDTFITNLLENFILNSHIFSQTNNNLKFIFECEYEKKINLFELILFKIKKSKISFPLRDEIKYFLIYDETEFFEDENFKVLLNKNSLELKKIIPNFINKLIETGIEVIVILNDEVTSISYYEITFNEKGINLIKISSDHVEEFTSFMELYNLIPINLFSYQGINLNDLKTDFSKKLKLSFLTLNNFENTFDNYLCLGVGEGQLTENEK